jgi:hypothetical protein
LLLNPESSKKERTTLAYLLVNVKRQVVAVVSQFVAGKRSANLRPALAGGLRFFLAGLQIPNFFSRREDFSSSQQCLRVLRGQKSINTEVTEMLRVLCVKA